MDNIKSIFVHCSATPKTMDIGVTEIRKWHVEERGWSDIGYHYVIRRNGNIEEGRPVTKTGAHVSGYNKNSIGICLVGGMNNGSSDANFTLAQYVQLSHLIEGLNDTYGKLELYGHRDVSTKDCPCFDVQALMEHL